MSLVGTILRRYFPKVYTFGRVWLLRKYVKQGDVVVQAGVDMGTNSSDVIYLSRIVGNTGSVIGIEPDKNNVQKMNEYIKQHKITNVTIVEKAVWKTKGNFPLLIGKKSMHNRLEDIVGVFDVKHYEAYMGTRMVETDTLDNILGDLGVEGVSHIRLTINGAEFEALEGMKKMLAKSYDRGLSMVIAAGKRSQPFGPFIDGELADKKIVSILRGYGFLTKHDENGRIIAWKCVG